MSTKDRARTVILNGENPADEVCQRMLAASARRLRHKASKYRSARRRSWNCERRLLSTNAWIRSGVNGGICEASSWIFSFTDFSRCAVAIISTSPARGLWPLSIFGPFLKSLFCIDNQYFTPPLYILLTFDEGRKRSVCNYLWTNILILLNSRDICLRALLCEMPSTRAMVL